MLKQRYLVYLVTKDKQLMHESPLRLITKGSFCGSFGTMVRNFHSEMSKAYSAEIGATTSVIGRSFFLRGSPSKLQASK
ncbi:MAG: DUF5895 domain-containing protein [Cyanobacteria bacterium P01_A01_bin.123]